MNKFATFLLVFIFAISLQSCFHAHSESAENYGVLSGVVKAFNESDYRKLTHQSDELIELTFENDARHYSKTQARFALQDFFKKNPATNFEIVHSSENKPSMKYIIGNYTSYTGEYRISIRMRENEGKYQINMIKFRKNS